MDADFRLFPEQASTVAPRVDAVFWYVTAISIFFSVLIFLLIAVFAIRYRRRSEDYFPKPIVGSKVMESTWIVVLFLISMTMFVWGASLYFDMQRMPDNALEVYVVGKQWMWTLQHPEGQREINKLHIPVGRPVKLIMTSEDVLHDFFIPAFRVKQDVVPGRYTYLWFQATRPGRFRLYCALYCGTEHSRMIGEVIALEPAEYESWLDGQKADRSLALQGRQLFQKLQCVTCHSAEAGGRAPVLEGFYGKRVPLADGRTVRVTDGYIRESILYPDAKIRAGYQPIMPSFKGQVSEDDLVRLLAFLKTLKAGETPPRVERSDRPEKTPEKKVNPK